jgi:hypothetical protein
MPPSISQGALNRLALRQPAASAVRSLSSTASTKAIGPESPRFIEVPKSAQRYAVSRPDIKGHIPPPKNLFPKRGANKTSPEYLAAATPEPTAEHQLREPASERTAWKRRMAQLRRENLREGLIALARRQKRAEKEVRVRAAAKTANREVRVNAPQRECDRLTSTTITTAMATYNKGVLPDPDREARIAAMKQRTEERLKALDEKRRDALHTLYMHARNFITTPEQLDKAIEEQFTERPFQHIQGKEFTNSIWDAEGAPPGVYDMMSEITGSQRRLVDYHAPPSKIVGKRMTKIAEELTGGKMD